MMTLFKKYNIKCIKSPTHTDNCTKGDFMHLEEKYNIKKVIIELIGTILGSAVMAIGVSLFLLPNQLSSGRICRNCNYNILSIKNTNG